MDSAPDASVQRTEQWYRQYGDAIYRRCLCLTGDQSRAWDLTQETFLRAHRSSDRFRGDSSVLTWLLTIANRRCLTALRRERSRPVTLEGQLGWDLDRLEGSADLERLVVATDLLQNLLPRLKKDVQQIVILRFVDEMEQEEIAAHLGISRKTVYRKLEGARRTAHKLLRRAVSATEAKHG